MDCLFNLRNRRYRFGPGLCFYPKFGVPLLSSDNGPGRTLVRSSEKGSGLTLVWQVRSLEKGTGQILVWQVRRKEWAEPWFGRFGEETGLNPGSEKGMGRTQVRRSNPDSEWVRRKERAKPWIGKFGERTFFSYFFFLLLFFSYFFSYVFLFSFLFSFFFLISFLFSSFFLPFFFFFFIFFLFF